MDGAALADHGMVARLVVRNGFLPERKIVTGLGEIAVKQTRVHVCRPA
jgi:hypothetical protein